jgi:hypothetical protein
MQRLTGGNPRGETPGPLSNSIRSAKSEGELPATNERSPSRPAGRVRTGRVILPRPGLSGKEP